MLLPGTIIILLFAVCNAATATTTATTHYHWYRCHHTPLPPHTTTTATTHHHNHTTTAATTHHLVNAALYIYRWGGEDEHLTSIYCMCPRDHIFSLVKLFLLQKNKGGRDIQPNGSCTWPQLLWFYGIFLVVRMHCKYSNDEANTPV